MSHLSVGSPSNMVFEHVQDYFDPKDLILVVSFNFIN